MPESDVTKMKVADLKRELKLRGLSVAGNKTELQDRLQTALIDGELTLDDTALPGDDLLDEDGVLTDEEDAKILVADENDLLKSPLNITPEMVPDSEQPSKTKDASEDDILTTPPSASKKIVLKRQTSATKNLQSTGNTSKENTEPTPPKTLKMSERNPITVGEQKNDAAVIAAKKVTQLSAKERMELRAKKFGINSNAESSNGATKTTNPSITLSKTADKVDPKQIELLKKRAERFGCVVSPKIVSLDAMERLEKRKKRFAGESDDGPKTAATADWSEKARKRLERFGNTASTAGAETTTNTKVPIQAPNGAAAASSD